MQKLANDDQKLLELIKKNPSKGMDKLMNQYSGLIYYIVEGKLSGRIQDIEECMSDVFVEFYSKINSIDLTKGSIKIYLATIATRRAVDKYRKLVANTELPILDDTLLEQSSVESPELVAMESEKREKLLDEINKLGDPDNQIMYRRYFMCQSVKEIADSIGMKSNSVTKRITRALEILRLRLEDYHYE